MVTDPVPRSSALKKEFGESDAQLNMPLPPAEPLRVATKAFQEALVTGEGAPVKRTGQQLLRLLSATYEVSPPSLLVLGSRPKKVVEGHSSWELFGDYTPATKTIRVWMRTAVLGKVTSFRGLLNTLLHEFCHHLDIEGLGYSDTPHTRGFYCRIDALYHLALATPPDQRKPLVWIKSGARWRVDWRKLRAPARAPAGR
jgi:hypothetical protein